MKNKKLDIIPDYIAYTDGSCNNMSPFGEGGSAFVLYDSFNLQQPIKLAAKPLLFLNMYGWG